MTGFLENLTKRNFESDSSQLRPRMPSRFEQSSSPEPIDSDEREHAPNMSAVEATPPLHNRRDSDLRPTPTTVTQDDKPDTSPAQAATANDRPTPSINVTAQAPETTKRPTQVVNDSASSADALTRRLNQLDAKLSAIPAASDQAQNTPTPIVQTYQHNVTNEHVVEQAQQKDKSGPKHEPSPPQKREMLSPKSTSSVPNPIVQPSRPIALQSTIESVDAAAPAPPVATQAISQRPPTQSNPRPAPKVIVQPSPPSETTPTVTVTIGRIEVRPPKSNSITPAKPMRPEPRIMSLDDYIRRRQGGTS